MRTLGYLATTVLASSLALPTLAGATTISYQSVGNFTGTSFSINGLTATAENGGSLSIISGGGLGVVGGYQSVYIDTSESVRFTFDSGGATGVAFGYNSASTSSNAARVWNIEGFDLQGVSLGLATFDVIGAVAPNTPVNVSGRFGNVALSAFRIFGPGVDISGGRLREVAFTDAPPPPAVPEPTTLLLCTTGLAFAGYRRRMRRN